MLSGKSKLKRFQESQTLSKHYIITPSYWVQSIRYKGKCHKQIVGAGSNKPSKTQAIKCKKQSKNTDDGISVTKLKEKAYKERKEERRKGRKKVRR
jgi:hypothetical protein